MTNYQIFGTNLTEAGMGDKKLSVQLYGVMIYYMFIKAINAPTFAQQSPFGLSETLASDRT